jgi:HD-GYP domain-containing protein (c-di-GMP phosphodiesterase class II)/anti-anti-sigma regulatory factor
MTRTRFEKLDIGGADRAGFQISGKLGFHENDKIEQLTQECLKRELKRVVFDFSGLTSLGGGVARILRSFVRELEGRGGTVTFVVTSSVVRDFLREEGSEISICSTLEEALSEENTKAPAMNAGGAEAGQPPAGEPGAETPDMPDPAEEAPEARDDGVILMAYDSGTDADDSAQKPAGEQPAPVLEASGENDLDGDDEIISEIFDSERPGSAPEGRAEDAVSPFSLSEQTETEDIKDLNKRLKRRILELKTLFSISADFNSIRERKKLLDIFLLTSIAQGGVESAVFYERRDGVFMPAIAKGIDEDDLSPMELSDEDLGRISRGRDVYPLENMPLSAGARQDLAKAGLEYVCPFIQGEETAGLVFLGRRIAGRGMQKEDFEFMTILVNLAKGAYSNAVMFERENERTLGIVKTLISLIEENTMLKGTSEIVSRYVGMVAKNMDYPEENFKDLIYGTVLRDMGMVKVSDLIVRSPRELSKDEWQIIKRHPEDGAGMLRRMKFNDHVVEIVLSHHERFNGEGYPRGLRGKDIPLGARIISVVESYAAMISERPNRPALSGREALETLRENYGLRYDREVVNQFAAIMEKELAKSVQPVSSVS